MNSHELYNEYLNSLKEAIEELDLNELERIVDALKNISAPFIK